MELIVTIAFALVFAEFIVGFYILAFAVGLLLLFVGWVSTEVLVGLAIVVGLVAWASRDKPSRPLTPEDITAWGVHLHAHAQRWEAANPGKRWNPDDAPAPIFDPSKPRKHL